MALEVEARPNNKQEFRSGSLSGILRCPLSAQQQTESLASELLNLPLFSALSPLRAAVMARACLVRAYRRGDLIVEQGSQSNALFVLLVGRAVTLRTDAQGREVFLKLMAAGALMGELSLIDGLGHSSSARCESACEVLVVPAHAMAVELAHNPGLAAALLSLLTLSLRHAHQRVSSMALESVRDRIIRQLWTLSVDHAERRQVPHKLSRQMLANMLGASREMVSRAMSDLQDEGKIGTLPDGTFWLHAAPFTPPVHRVRKRR